MSTTDKTKLREMLDERRVEYSTDDAKTVKATHWKFGENGSAVFSEYDDGECVFVTSGCTWTPEQAVAATLGRGECHDKNGFDPNFGFECVECGTTVDTYMCSEYPGIQEQFRYCPGCGARVVTT